MFEKGLGHRTHYLAARDSRGVSGVLPLVEVRSPIFGRALTSLPYVNYGGVLARTPEAADVLLREATRIAHERGLNYVLLRHRQRVFETLPVRTHKVTMLLPLKADPDAMWAGLDRKVRNQVRKGEKSNLTVSAGGLDLLDEFYRIFARNMRDLGTPVYGRGLFSAILEAFPERGSASRRALERCRYRWRAQLCVRRHDRSPIRLVAPRAPGAVSESPDVLGHHQAGRDRWSPHV